MNTPLAERMRPKTLEDYTGQTHLIGSQGTLSPMLAQGQIPSLLLWGPPGTGKTTLATLIAKSQERPFYSLSAIHSGVKEYVKSSKKQKTAEASLPKRALTFIDEIHRFSKSQQDSL